eukprot:8799397-Pyramimonas_sp.AAC.1
MWVGGMRAKPLGPSAELLWGHEACDVCADMGAGGTHANSATGTFGGAPMDGPWGNETFEGRVGLGAGGACELSHGDLRWNSYGATKRVR